MKKMIDFETAMLVFNDLQRIEIYDMEHSTSEDRYNTIGMAVSYTHLTLPTIA